MANGTVSQPYDPLPDPPKSFTLHEALKATQDKDGHYHCGKLEFETKKDYVDFREAQIAIGGTKTQLAALNYVEQNGAPPNMEPMNAPPDGTDINKLLDASGQKADKDGYLHLGSLRVKETEYAQFAEGQKALCAKNPEGLAALYHMEHSNDKPPPTFRVTGDDDRHARYDSQKNTIYWNPNSAARDESNGALIPPASAIMHEEAHWASHSMVGETLVGVPAKEYETMAEQHVIEGAEAREMQIRGLTQRHAHEALMVPVKGVESTTVSITMKQDGNERELRAPFQQSGRVIEQKDGWATIAVRGDGAQPEHRMSFKVDQLATAMGQDMDTAKILLNGAQSHKDTISLSVTNDGRVVYDDPAQEKRIHDHPQENPPFPKAMTPTPSATPAQPTPARASPDFADR